MDIDNEGHPGALAVNYVRDGSFKGWMDKANPDVILMHLGTNDALNKKPTNDIIAAYSTFVEQSRAKNPKVRWVVSFHSVHTDLWKLLTCILGFDIDPG